MKLKFNKNVPNELITLLNECDFSLIPKNQHIEYLRQIKDLANKFLPINKSKIEYVEHEVGNCPKHLVNLINSYDYTAIQSNFDKEMVMTLIRNYLKNLGIIKNGVIKHTYKKIKSKIGL